MAEGPLCHDGGNRFEVSSAGTKPDQVRPEAIEVMRELGIDISSYRSKSVDEFAGQEFDYVITVCDNANEICPLFPGRTRRIHWSFQDPAEIDGDDATRISLDYVVAKMDPRLTQDLDLRIEVFDFDLDAVPTARRRLTSIGHGLPRPSSARSVQQEAKIASRQPREAWGGVQVDMEV
jgi:arsenate reductase